MKKIFTVVINNKEYDVWDIPGKEQDPGNGEVKTWWVYMGDRLPDDVTPPADSERWEHYHASITRHLWDIRFTQKNTTKEKWGSTHFRNHTHVEMRCNNILVYEFGTTGTMNGLSFAMAKVQYLQTILSEHCYNFFDTKSNDGRKICWYGLPATVKVRSSEGWCIDIIPDYTAGLSKDQWWHELKYRQKKYKTQDPDEVEEDKEDDQEFMQNDCIRWGDALSDQHIDWFRK